MKLRDYQEQALAAEDEYRREHPDENRLLIQMATGLGKTITFAERARRWLQDGKDLNLDLLGGHRVLVLVHTDELVRQAVAKIRLVAGERWTVGIVKAGQNETDADIVVASVQTLANPGRRQQITDVGYIIVDEAHHAVARTYQEILRWYGSTPRHQYDGGPHVPVLGLTATPERADGLGLGTVWHNVVFSRDISWAVRKGYLVPPVGYTVRVPEMGTVAGAGDATVDRAIVDSMAPELLVDAWLEQRQRDIAAYSGSANRSTVVFAPLVRSAEAFRDAFRAAGVSAEVVHGGMPLDQRRVILESYELGATTVLCNAMVLTEGWDSPRTECVAWARPTTSRSLFIQGVGRGLRPRLDGPRPRTEQDCVLLVLADGTPGLTSIADLSDRPGLEAKDGKTLLALEDEFDLSRDLEPDAPNAYAGRAEVVEFDPLVARSEKVWTKTKAGALFIPFGKHSYFTILPDNEGYAVATVTSRPAGISQGAGSRRLHRNVPDLELAMSLAEDEAQERGGDLGRLLADKSRPWRKAVPSQEMQDLARSLGLGAELDKIMAQRSAGKAGRLSDLINRERASRLIDPAVRKLAGLL